MEDFEDDARADFEGLIAGNGIANSFGAIERFTGDFTGEVGLDGTIFLRIDAPLGEAEASTRVSEDALTVVTSSERSAKGTFGTSGTSG
jgi:hypothetical protein